MLRASILFTFVVSLAFGQGQQRGTPSIQERTSGMQKLDGYFPLYWDERTGNLWLEIPRFDTDFLYTTSPDARRSSCTAGRGPANPFRDLRRLARRAAHREPASASSLRPDAPGSA